MIEADRDKLVKILRMFSSDHDGEVASAARRAHKMVKDRMLDWEDLIIPIQRSDARQDRSWKQQWHQEEAHEDDDEAGLIHKCSELNMSLSEWEQEFISSISESIVEWGRLTAKQRSVLDRIVNKLKLRGLWDDI